MPLFGKKPDPVPDNGLTDQQIWWQLYSFVHNLERSMNWRQTPDAADRKTIVQLSKTFTQAYNGDGYEKHPVRQSRQNLLRFYYQVEKMAATYLQADYYRQATGHDPNPGDLIFKRSDFMVD